MPPSLMDKFTVASALWASTALSSLTIAIDSRDAFGGSVSYTYDSSGRLTTATYDTGVTITYTYDSNGNRSQDVVAIPSPLTSPSPPNSPPTPPPVVGVTISSNADNLNLWNYLVSNHFATSGKSGTWEVMIASGVTIGSTSTAAPAFDTGVFPAGSTLTIINNGIIEGAGGAGGVGGSGGCGAGGAGQAGGPAFRAQFPLSLANNSAIEGGGGGGGGSASYGALNIGSGGGGGAGNLGGGGGGPGMVVGNPPYGPYYGGSGSPGTAAAGGAGGYKGAPYGSPHNPGGPGGYPGKAGYAGTRHFGLYCSAYGGSGGAGGAAIVGSSNVTFAAQGTLAGPLQ